MRDKINNLYNQINTPEEWKIDIKAKMKAAMLEEQKSNVVTFSDRAKINNTVSGNNTDSTFKKKSKRKMPIAISIAGVAVAAGIVLGIVVNGNSKVKLLSPDSSINTTDTSDYADVHVIDSSEVVLGGTADGGGVSGSVKKYSAADGTNVYISEISTDQIPTVASGDTSYINDKEVIIIESVEDNESVYTAFVKDDNIKIVGRDIEQSKFLDIVNEYLKQ